MKIDGRIITVNANSSAQPNQYACKYVRYDYATSGGDLLWKASPKEEQIIEETPVIDESINDNAPVEEKKFSNRGDNSAEQRANRHNSGTSIG